MRIGIDAKWFFEGPISNKIVIQKLVEHLVANNQGDELVFFLNKAHKDRPFPFKGANIHTVYVWAGNNQLSNLFVLPFVAQKYKVDVVLFQNHTPFLGSFEKVTYIHDVIFLTHPQFFSKKELLYFHPIKYTTRFADKVITISESEKRRLVQCGVADEKVISVVYHGSDTDFKPLVLLDSNKVKITLAKFELPESYLLYVGRLNIRKNIQAILKALPMIDNKKLKLVIVGEKEWKTFNIEQLIADLKIESRVMFTGSVSKEELIGLYANARYFCFPSFAEGFGLPALEAMSAGVPTIVSKHTSLEEVCGDAGLYIDPFKPSEVADIINHLEQNPVEYTEIKERGVIKAATFSWDLAAQKLLMYIKA